MLQIRQEQLATITHAGRERFVARMASHVRLYFASAVESLDDQALHGLVERTASRARDYGLASEQDVCRFLNLCAVYGWDFDEQPDNRWMRELLTDAAVTDPGQRLRRLVDRCLHQRDVERHNQRIAEEFAARHEVRANPLAYAPPGTPPAAMDRPRPSPPTGDDVRLDTKEA